MQHNRIAFVKMTAPVVYPKYYQIVKKAEYICFCGNSFIATVKSVNKGTRSSCGCYNKKCTSAALTKHGLTNSKIYGVWCGIKRRCYNKNEKSYKDYGGRGINVCDRWLNSFQNFYDDMNEGYKEGLEIDRKDNSGNYCKSNCRWVTREKNSKNKRTTVMIEYNGVKLPMSEFCAKFKIPYGNFQMRLHRGMTVKEAVETPYRKSRTSNNLNIPIKL